jgi:hypothetical protein
MLGRDFNTEGCQIGGIKLIKSQDFKNNLQLQFAICLAGPCRYCLPVKPGHDLFLFFGSDLLDKINPVIVKVIDSIIK